MSGLLNVKANNYLGADYDDYLLLIEALAADPVTYAKARSAVLKNLKRDYIEKIQKDVIDALSTGKITKATGTHSIFRLQGGSQILKEEKEFTVNYPDQDTLDLSLAIAKTVNNCFQDVVDKILPKRYLKMAGEKQVLGVSEMGV